MVNNPVRVIAHLQGMTLVAFLAARFLPALFALASWFDKLIGRGWFVAVAAVLL